MWLLVGSPHKLFCFPSQLKYLDARKRWIRCLKGENKDKSAWNPGVSDRICSFHFADGVPTVANPDPTVNMGYDLSQKKSRRVLFRKPSEPQANNQSGVNVDTTVMDWNDTTEPMETESSLLSPMSTNSSVVFDHSYTVTPQTRQCEKCHDKTELINSLVNKVNKLSIQVKCATRERILNNKRSVFTWRKIKTDAKMNFYTGIQSIAMFNVLFLLLSPFLSKLRYWRGAKRTNTYSKVKRRFISVSKNKKIVTSR